MAPPRVPPPTAVIFVLWGIAIAWAACSLYKFARRTLRLIELEREQANKRLRKSVQAALREHRHLVDDLHFRLSEMTTLMQAIAHHRGQERPWTEEQIVAIAHKCEAPYLPGCRRRPTPSRPTPSRPIPILTHRILAGHRTARRV